jgi:nucleoside-triphosphatase THEP1
MTNLVKQEFREEVEATVQAVTHLVAVVSAVFLMRFSAETHHLVVEEVNVNRLVRNVGQI